MTKDNMISLSMAVGGSFVRQAIEPWKKMSVSVQVALAAGVPDRTVEKVVRNVQEEAKEVAFWGSAEQIADEVSRRLAVLREASANRR
ncbi:hypothetical protein BA190_09455 [Labrys sp. WJW]|uniref:hypothetical protein n=1 Tax=Labrys sp. WJW TaxID=1737983 RepID=UPI00082C0098|nr:hypothetical protein [Labrys sp. WJW]OCC05132.1 hypothetical protein BA190_09455 [Labrys sp. WJW]